MQRGPADPPHRPNRRRIYLANPFGFAESGRHALGRIQAELESLDMDVWEPFAGCAGQTPRETGRLCLQHIRDSDGVFAVVNGNPPDEGVMIEIGYAFALGKPVFLFRDDIRTCAETPEYPLNLMTYAGLPDDWRSHWYTGIGEIADGKKALARWARSRPGG
jgi:nucleoside 2-deoxyribosyltransferase